MSVVLSEHLPLLAAAPYGIQKLRSLILGLAVRGKLVPQDPNDESADALLLRIAQERARLDGVKTPKTTNQNPVDNQEGLFELPESWVWARFGEVALHNAGKTLDRGRNSGQPRDYITTSNLYWGRFELGALKQMLIDDDEMERCTARKNDLLICEGGEAGRAAVWPYDRVVCFQNHVHRARFFGGIDPYFGYYFFEWLNASGEIAQYRKGVGISNMSGKALASIPFPLPPLAEQHRIVAKVAELMALCDRLEAEQADGESAQVKLVETLLGMLTHSTDAADFVTNWKRLAQHFDTLFNTEFGVAALKQTVLQLAVMGKLVPQDPSDEPASGLLTQIAQVRAQPKAEVAQKNPGKIPVMQGVGTPIGWSAATLPELCAIGGGATPSKAKAFYWGEGLPWVSPKDMKVEHILDAQDHVTELALNETRLPRVPSGSLLIVVRGMILVHSFPIATTQVEVAINQDMKSLTPFIPEMQPFLALALRGWKQQILSLVDRSTHGTCKLQSEKLFAFPIGIPPLAEQHRIVAKVDELLTLCDRLKTDLANSRHRQARLASALIESALKAA